MLMRLRAAFSQSRTPGRRRCLLVALLAALLCVTSPALAQPEEPDAAATRDYAVALGFQKKKLYAQAATRWSKFVQTYPQDKRLANAHYHWGVCQFQQQQFPEAAATFRNVLAKFPQFEHLDGAQFNLGLVLYNLAHGSMKPEDYKQAAAEFAAVPAKFAKSEHVPDALYYQAESLYLAGDKEAAVPVYLKVIADFPNNPLLPDVYYALGTAQQELTKHTDAAQTFQTFLQKFADHSQAGECKLRLGMALSDLGKYAEAEQQFAQAAALKNFPLADFALLRHAQALFAQKKLPEAARLYESLPKKFAESTYIGAALLTAGKCRYQTGQFAEANTNLAAVVALKQAEAPEAAYWLGRTLIQLNKPAEAVAALDQAIAAYPQSEFLPQLAFARIDALYEQEARRKETVALYADFAKKYPMHELAADAQYRAGLTALKLEDYAPAQQHADAFLANAAFAQHALFPDALFVAGESSLLAAEPNLAKAEGLYRRLIKDHPMHAAVPQAQVRIGFCLYSAKKLDEAAAHLTTAAPTLKEPPLLAEAHLLVGRCHSDAVRPKEAAAAFRASLAADPKWERGDEVLFALALSLRTQDDLANAAAELNKLNQQYPQSTYRDRAFYQLGEIALQQKQYDAAVANYRQVVNGFAKSETAPPAQYGIGAALFEKRDYQNTVTELTKLLQTYPQAEITPSGVYLRGLAYQRLDNFQAAAADFTQFLTGKPPENDALDARFALALCQAGLKQHPQAITTLVTLLKDKPDYPAADKAYYELGFSYLETKQEKEAAESFRQLATKLPESPLAPESWFRVGEFHENSEQLPEAAKAYAAGLQLAKLPELRERLQYKLGWVQYEQAAYADAAATFQAQLKDHPQGPLVADATYLAGESLFRQNKFNVALPLFTQVVALKAEKYHARALYRSGTCAANLEQWPASQTHFDALTKQFPKFEQVNEARYGLGFALQKQNKLDEAKQVYEQVTEATDTETAAKSRFMIGECAFAQKKYEEAYEHFLEAALGYPYEEWQALGHFEAARCFIELKNEEQARKSLEAVVTKFPKHPRAKDAATLLAKLGK